ncbi:hypothetical protein [uncultured Adlercreutzia sp.]|uniref:hypothetical protein n=1 Tax=uncultured Adlercreutzia sp. TaxID=875803 RepID=UPI0026747B9C|nr:hypothetical protein [uncultured Adlercreutzia sp.]
MGVRAARARLAGRGEAGQATVELAVALPVVIIVAVVVVNALTFFGTCAAFDRVARQTVCAEASAPGAGEDVGTTVARVEGRLEEAFAASNVTVAVRAEGAPAGLVRFTARIEYHPTLFGLGMRTEVLGVALPSLAHEVDMAVDVYRPGMLF